MFKKFIIILFTTMTVLAPAMAVAQEIHMGSWPDGANIAWQCSKRATGTVKFIIELPDGTKYAGMFSCGEAT